MNFSQQPQRLRRDLADLALRLVDQPLVEYYITENHVGSPNTAGTYEGQVTSDGGTYNV